MEGDEKLKMAVIAGAAEALNFIEKNPREPKEEAMQHVTKKADEIIKKIDIEEF